MFNTPEQNPFTFIAKQEILTNLLKTYRAVLVLGVSLTGKTTTALKSAESLGAVHYFSAKRFNHEQIRQIVKGVQFPELVDDLPAISDILILDDMQEASKDIQLKIATLLQKGSYKNLIVISPYFVPIKDLFWLTDIAVRFTPETANVITFE